ncbi:MAG: cytochrome b/b6 domain-containing protein [Actinobacteria bacterium]|nr:cytochrome b/b6 domain-containing protein [Actinomycetota bacterium]
MDSATDRIERHPRRVRRFHGAVWVVTLGLLVTGWWILLGGEGRPSPLARATGVADTRLHVWMGWALAALTVGVATVGCRGIATFLRETVRRDRGDAGWWRRWPAAAFTGRFARHEGLFDPGQRIANVLLVGGLLVLVVTGTAMTLLHGGPVFASMGRIHRWATIAISPVIVGHVLIAAGLLPGYRGAARSMHVDGRVRTATARSLWPGWADRVSRPADPHPDADRHEEASCSNDSYTERRER